jgi:hypothetical protein
MSNNQGGGGKIGGSDKKPESNPEKKSENIPEKTRKSLVEKSGATAVVLASFASSAFSTSVASLSPFKLFTKYIRAIAGLLLLAIIGNAFAFYQGSLLVATLILLIEPMFVMSLLSMVTRAFIMPFANAVRGNTIRIKGSRILITKRPSNIILRPFYDYVALLTVGLPYALAWYWQGKIIGIGILMLSYANTKYLGYAIAYYVIVFSIASAVLTLINRYGSRAPMKSLAALMSSFSYIMAIYTGALFTSIAFGIIFWFNTALFTTIGAIGAFLLSFITIKEMNKLSPGGGKFPATWSIIAMIIGASALMKFWGIYVASMVAITIYLVMLYLMSGDAEWLWYTIIAVPSAPVVAYYLGYVTKLLLDNGGLTIGEIIAGALMTVLFVLFIVALAIAIIMIFIAILPAIGYFLVDIFIFFIIIIFFVILAVFALMFFATLASMINIVGMIGSAYNYLVYPA